VRALTVSDVHYDLRQLDWVLAQAADFDLVVVIGDLLDIASTVPVEAQVPVILGYLERLVARSQVAVCSGNHDLTGRDADGERAALWLEGAASLGVVERGPLVVGDALVTVCPWWDGPLGRDRQERELTELAEARSAVAEPAQGRWIWVYHWPPPDLPVSWIGTKYYGDADLAGWVERFAPDLVLTGHVHQSPWVDGGSWISAQGGTWIVNAGRQRGPVPTHVVVDLDGWTASWTTDEGTEVQDLHQVRSAVGQ
jgi:Icc-related predicted phosphoesterase